MEGELNKGKDDIYDIKREVDDLITSLQVYSQGEELLRILTKELQDRVAELFTTTWGYVN